MNSDRIHIPDDEIARMPVPDMVAAVDEALRALGCGMIDNPPRIESVGSSKDPDFFQIDMQAAYRENVCGIGYRCRKVIEEHGARDGKGTRVPGSRRAWIEFEDPVRKNRITLDAEFITNARTAIAALLGARYLLLEERPVRLALIGTGRIAREVVRCASHVTDIGWIQVTSRNQEHRAAFVSRMREHAAGEIRAAESVSECMEGADAVIAAVPSSEPVLSFDDCRGADHISLVGGDPRVVLADRTLWERSAIVVDNPVQARKSGDLIRARSEQWLNSIKFARVETHEATLADASLGRLDELRGERTMLLLTGIATFDLALARLAYERRLESTSSP